MVDALQVSVHYSTIRMRLGKSGMHGRVPNKNHYDENQDSNKTKQRLNILEGACPVPSGVKVTQNFRKEHHTNSQMWCDVL